MLCQLGHFPLKGDCVWKPCEELQIWWGTNQPQARTIKIKLKSVQQPNICTAVVHYFVLLWYFRQLNFNNNWHTKISVALWKSSRRFHMTSFRRTLPIIANKNIVWLGTVLPVQFFFRITSWRICKNLGNVHARSAHNYAQGCKRRCHRLLVLLLLDIINTSYLYY